MAASVQAQFCGGNASDLQAIGQVVGLLLEAVADQQKSEHRRKTNTHVSGGLYAFSRHPNYLGEIIFWAGTYVVAVGSLTGVLQWVSATLGLVAILGVMTGATNGLDKRQVQRASLPMSCVGTPCVACEDSKCSACARGDNSGTPCVYTPLLRESLNI